VHDLIESAGDEVRELHLRDRPIAAQRGADADADDGRLRDRRVDDAHLAEFFEEALRRAERAAIAAYILAEDEHLRVSAHFFGERLAKCFEVREVLAHSRNLVKPRRHEDTKNI